MCALYSNYRFMNFDMKGGVVMDEKEAVRVFKALGDEKMNAGRTWQLAKIYGLWSYE